MNKCSITRDDKNQARNLFKFSEVFRAPQLISEDTKKETIQDLCL